MVLCTELGYDATETYGAKAAKALTQYRTPRSKCEGQYRTSRSTRVAAYTRSGLDSTGHRVAAYPMLVSDIA
eukprot:3796277-Rhodomonas_salina.2